MQSKTFELLIDADSFRAEVRAVVAEYLDEQPKPIPDTYLYTEPQAAKALGLGVQKMAKLRNEGKFTASVNKRPYRYTWQRIVEIGDWLGRQDQQPEGIAN